MRMDRPLLLLVEDEPLLALTMEEELVDAGFSVVVAANGTEAIRYMESDVSRFIALVTDIRLPAANGWTVAKRARQLAPTMPVVYMSGDSAADWRANGVPESIMLAKPFPVLNLVTAMAQLLNQSPTAGDHSK